MQCAGSKNGYGEPCPRQGGKFTREETDLVRRAVEEYCTVKCISTARLCSECDHKAELKGAWMEIAKRLPHRTVQSVYRHGLRQLHPFKRGPWTEGECNALQELVARMGKKWSAIQAKLNRSADSCRDKHREMSIDYTKGRWKEGETEILKRLIREHLRADPHADIKELGKMVEQEGIIVPWSTISKRMSKRSRLSCFKKWQKMTGLYSPSDQHKLTTPGRGLMFKENPHKPNAIPPPRVAASPAVAIPNAPTAGAAAAVAAATAAIAKHVANPVLDMLVAQPVSTFTGGVAAPPEVIREYDLYLLQHLQSSGATTNGDVDWATLPRHVLGDPQERWNGLVNEWEAEGGEGEGLSDIAKIIFDRKQQEGDAKTAAETVEAIDLPIVPGLAASEREAQV